MNRLSSFDRDQLLACARGEMFGPGNARLPAPPTLMSNSFGFGGTNGSLVLARYRD